jgi:DNA-directed RNA polymerase specialized sigma subunit
MAKYDSLRKLHRNTMLRDFVKSHPELSLREIGDSFNISASRVCRILNSKSTKGDTDAKLSSNQSQS